MTRDEELALLIEEQRKDDTYEIEHEYMGRFRALSLDSEVYENWIAVDIDGNRILPHELNPHVRRGVWAGGALAQIPHGTYNGYNNYRCRCDKCVAAGRKANVEYNRRWRKRQYAARPMVECACGCGATFKPIPSTKRYATIQCVWRDAKRRERKAA